MIDSSQVDSDINQRDSYIRHVRGVQIQMLQSLLPIKQFLDFLSKDMYHETPQEKLYDLEQIVQKAKKLLSEQQAASIKGKANIYGKVFQTESKINEREAQKWFRWFFASVVISIVTTIILIYFLDSSGSVQNIVDFILNINTLGKLFIFSMLFFATSLFRTNYISMKHQQSLNVHRHNALSVYSTLVESIQKTRSESEKETLNTLLLELSKAIFDSRDTGYTKTSTGRNFPMNVINWHKNTEK